MSRSPHKVLSTPDGIHQMMVANGIEWSDHEDDIGLGMGPTYSNTELNERIRSGVYNELDTPEQMLARVRGKMAGCSSKSELEFAETIVDTLAIDGETGLTAEQLAWIPKPKTYQERKDALAEKIAPALKAIADDIPDDIAKAVDNDFEHLLDPGAKGDKPTKRIGLFQKCMAWLWCSDAEEYATVEAVEEEKVR